MPIRILIADDDAFIREGLRIILGMDPEFEVVACVDNGNAAVDMCLNSNIDIALLDIQMPHLNGVEATRQISLQTATRPLILTTFDDDRFILDAIRNGAKGYLLKNNPPEKIKDSLRLVYNGGSVMQDVVMDKLKEELSSSRYGSKIDKSLFSERELEIMALIAQGLSNKDVAARIFISEGTVKNYITSILNKTGLEHRTQIAIYYLNGGNLIIDN